MAWKYWKKLRKAIEMVDEFKKWQQSTLGELDHFPDCKSKCAPLDVCGCGQRHAFEAGRKLGPGKCSHCQGGGCCMCNDTGRAIFE